MLPFSCMSLTSWHGATVLRSELHVLGRSYFTRCRLFCVELPPDIIGAHGWWGIVGQCQDVVEALIGLMLYSCEPICVLILGRAL